MNNLTTTNPNQLEYQNQLLKIAILGGIRLDGLDRMRVTVKIQGTEVDSLAVRHNLDLYNDTQVEKLIRKTATKLEIGTSVIEASINELIEALEKYRLEQLEQTDQKPKTKQLTEKEKSEALQLLQSENLLTYNVATFLLKKSLNFLAVSILSMILKTVVLSSSSSCCNSCICSIVDLSSASSSKCSFLN